MFKYLLILLSVVYLTGVNAIDRKEIVISEEFISPEWEKYDCHSSSIVQTNAGQILAVWKGGQGEGKSNVTMTSNVGIWMAHREGETWNSPEQIHFEPDSVIWNPVLGKLPSGELLLFYRVGETPGNAVAFLQRSIDSGFHWLDPEWLPAGINGPTKNKPLVLEDGTLLCPSSAQSGLPTSVYHATAVWMDISKDGGKSWSKSAPLVIEGQPFGVIEPAIFHDQEGNLRLLCRDRARRLGAENGVIWTATSCDDGMTWSALEKTDLPNPDSAFDVVDLGNGRLVLFYNHSHWERFPLSIAISTDGGKTWEKKCDLEEKTGEFPAAIRADDGLIHVVYAYEIETGQRRIKHAAIEPSKLFP